jgi:hypothetical protein
MKVIPETCHAITQLYRLIVHEIFAAGRLVTNNQSIIYHYRGWRNGNMHINHEKIN